MLKNHKKYLKQLYAYAKSTRVKILHVNYVFTGEWRPHRRQVLVQKHLKECDKVSTILHELGHALDDSLSSKTTLKRLDIAYRAEDPSEIQQRMIIQTELRAWKYAYSIASQLKIPLGKWFYRDKQSSVNSYRAFFKS